MGADVIRMDVKKRRFVQTWRVYFRFPRRRSVLEKPSTWPRERSETLCEGKPPSVSRVYFRVISLDERFGGTRAKTRGKSTASSKCVSLFFSSRVPTADGSGMLN